MNDWCYYWLKYVLFNCRMWQTSCRTTRVLSMLCTNKPLPWVNRYVAEALKHWHILYHCRTYFLLNHSLAPVNGLSQKSFVQPVLLMQPLCNPQPIIFSAFWVKHSFFFCKQNEKVTCWCLPLCKASSELVIDSFCVICKRGHYVADSGTIKIRIKKIELMFFVTKAFL